MRVLFLGALVMLKVLCERNLFAVTSRRAFRVSNWRWPSHQGLGRRCDEDVWGNRLLSSIHRFCLGLVCTHMHTNSHTVCFHHLRGSGRSCVSPHTWVTVRLGLVTWSPRTPTWYSMWNSSLLMPEQRDHGARSSDWFMHPWILCSRNLSLYAEIVCDVLWILNYMLYCSHDYTIRSNIVIHVWRVRHAYICVFTKACVY